MAVFAGYVSILLSVAFLYCFVCVDERGTGVLAKMKVFFWVMVPNFLKKTAARLCGHRFVRIIERIAHYICNEPNPLVQLIYFVCAFGGYYVFVRDGFPLIPNPRLPTWHMYFGSILMFTCYASYFLACWVDPGRLAKDTERGEVLRALKRFKFDNIIFTKGAKCRTCNIEKPSRSKHCPMCNHCVEKLDHHCVWINQCVGLHNYKFFLSFLYLHAVLCTYGVWGGWQILMWIIERDHLMDLTF